MQSPNAVRERFMSKVDQRGHDECWPWRGSFLPSGYGAFWWGQNNVTAHRAAYTILVGHIPDGLVVRHSCDNKWCVNPAHLLAGTQAQNIADKVTRDRQAKGEGHGMATKNAAMVTRVKLAFNRGESQAEIARREGVDRSFVNGVVHGKSWAHVCPELTVQQRQRKVRHGDDLVRAIRAAHAMGCKQRSIAFCSGTTVSYVNRVVRGLVRPDVE